MSGLNIIVIGCNPMTRKGIEAILSLSSCNLVGIIMLSPQAAIGKANYDPMPEIAKQFASITLFTHDINSLEVREWISGKNPDVLLQLGWSQIFSKEVLTLPRLFCLGVHPAPLPVGRGAAVINWKIIEGGGDWGVSLFIMEPKTDTGDILDFEPFIIEPRDDVYTAFCKVDNATVKMLARTLPRFADGTYCREKQDKTNATRYFKRKPEDGKLDINWDVDKCVRFIRALTHPYPGAFLLINNEKNEKLLVWSAEKGKITETGAQPGTILKIIQGEGLLIQVGEHSTLLIKWVTPANGLECWADEWALECGYKEEMNVFI